MPPEDENVIDVKKVGYLKYVDSPTKKDQESFLKGYESARGRSKTNVLTLYDINNQAINVITKPEGHYIYISFRALLNYEYLPLISAGTEKYEENSTFVKAQDILHKINLAKEVTYGKSKTSKGKTQPFQGYAMIPGTKVDNDEVKEVKRSSFEKFEDDLGKLLYNDSEIVILSEHVKEKCLGIIRDLNTKNQQLDENEYDKSLEETFTGGDGNPTIAGDTKFKTNVVNDIINSVGNVRETMTIFMNLAKAKDFITSKDYANTALDPIIKANIGATGSGRLIPNSGIRSKDVKNQKKNRGKAENNPFLQEKSKQEIDDPDLNLTDREKELQESGEHNDGLLKWAEGQNVWRINEEADFVKAARELLLPLKAGPSGTTDRLFQLNDTFNIGIPPEHFIALVIAYLLPIKAHTLVEIATAARPYIGIEGNSDMGNFYNELLVYSPIVGNAMFKIISGGNYPDVADMLGIV